MTRRYLLVRSSVRLLFWGSLAGLAVTAGVLFPWVVVSG